MNKHIAFESLESRTLFSRGAFTGIEPRLPDQVIVPRPFEQRRVVMRPSGPTELTQVTSTSNSLKLVWVDNSNNEAGFRIDQWSGKRWLTIGKTKPNITYFINGGLKPNTAYAYRILAFNSSGVSSQSAFLGDAMTIATDDVAMPTQIAASIISPAHTLLQFFDNATNDLGYNILASTNGDAGPFNFVGAVSGTKSTGLRVFDFTQAQPGQTYTFQISGFTTSKVSAPSLPATAIVPASSARNLTLSNGKYYTSGRDSQASDTILVYRWNADGSVDTTFGTNGAYAITSTHSSDFGGVDFLGGLPDGTILANVYGTAAFTIPPYGLIVGQTLRKFNSGITSPYDPNTYFVTPDYFELNSVAYTGPITEPDKPRVFIDPNGKILVSYDALQRQSANIVPTIASLNADLTEIWSASLSAKPDSFYVLPNGLTAVVVDSTLNLFSSSGQRVL